MNRNLKAQLIQAANNALSLMALQMLMEELQQNYLDSFRNPADANWELAEKVQDVTAEQLDDLDFESSDYGEVASEIVAAAKRLA